MKILVLNSGSSSIKFQLLDMTKHKSLASGIVEQIGEVHSHDKIRYFNANHQEMEVEHNDTIPNHKVGLQVVNKLLIESGLIQSMEELDGIGHRVVHGGEVFSDPVLITKEVKDEIKLLSPLAPLHNPANVEGIRVAMEEAPNVPQVAVFDTAYHQSIPPHAYLYALPYEWYEKHGVRRYGFHGTSHRFVAKVAADFLGKPIEESNFITLHLGNGASATAIKNGKSIDTSMGLTPLEGLIMGTRSGDIDPAIHYYIYKKEGMNLERIDTELNKKSGLKGICGVNDMRAIGEKAEAGDEQAQLALDMFCYRIKKYLGSYAVALGRIDAIIFTGGIGENANVVRQKVCEELDLSIGAALDMEKNSERSREARDISTTESKVRILVVPTNEELEIASQTEQIIRK